ncbi:potassium channel family protein [Panacagrimonas sp.]|uniref:potassium channel family protein n=1 Tax=Panacagrimonas sp. TaxID=2480088 RepID=UPI003B5158A4
MALPIRRKRTAPHSGTRLFRRTPRSPARILGTRVLLILGVLVLLTAVLWWDRAGLKDHLDGHISFSDVVYFTAVTVTTVGYGDVVPVTDRARLIDAVLVTPVRLFVWLVFLGTAYELLLQKWIEGWRMKRMQSGLKDHVIICGYGHSGQSAAKEIVACDGDAVVIDLDPRAVQRAADAGHIALQGDATREADLAEARVDKASAVLICVGRDDTAVLATLTARHLHPGVRVISSVREFENLKLVRQAGADTTVLPSQVGGYLMADAVRTRYLNAYVSDMLTSSGRISLQERVAGPTDVGRRMRDLDSELVVRVYRQGEPIGFWEGDKTVIQIGDVLLTIVPNPDLAD